MAKSISCPKLKELTRQMQHCETAIEPKDVKPILVAAMGLIADKAKQLLRSLTKRSTSLPPGWEHIEAALVAQGGKSQYSSTAFAKVFRRAAPQAIWIEYGHKMIGHKPGKRNTGKFVTANPFFRPAIDITRSDVRKMITEGIRDLIRRGVGIGR